MPEQKSSNADVKTKYVGGGIIRSEEMSARDYDAERFLSELREDRLPEGFSLSNEAFCELAERMNGGDKELAKELLGNGILALLAAKKGTGIDGLMALAEVCAEG